MISLLFSPLKACRSAKEHVSSIRTQSEAEMVTVGGGTHIAHALARQKALQTMRKKTRSAEDTRHEKEEERNSKTIAHHDQHSYPLL